MDEEEVIPPQYKVNTNPLDFRSAVVTANRKTASSRKRGRDEEEEEEEAMQEDCLVAEEVDPATARARKRRVYETNAGKVSGRTWKKPAQRFSSLAVKNESQKAKSDWDRKMKERDQKKALNERIKETKREALAKVRAEKKRREEVKKAKEERQKAATISQKITNTKKVKSMSKKQAKNVRWVAGE